MRSWLVNLPETFCWAGLSDTGAGLCVQALPQSPWSLCDRWASCAPHGNHPEDLEKIESNQVKLLGGVTAAADLARMLPRSGGWRGNGVDIGSRPASATLPDVIVSTRRPRCGLAIRRSTHVIVTEAIGQVLATVGALHVVTPRSPSVPIAAPDATSSSSPMIGDLALVQAEPHRTSPTLRPA